MSTLQAILAVWLVITACLAVIMAVDVIIGWSECPRGFKRDEVGNLVSTNKGITMMGGQLKGTEPITFHYPMTDEQEAREETIKKNDAKGIDTPIDDLI